MRKSALSLAIIGLALPFLAASPAQAQNARTWVSGVGDDLSPTCSRAAPCKTFAAAIAVTNAGGEINCLDSGGFGTLTITKAITVACEVGTAGILATGGTDGIVVSAASTDVVTLRGLDIDGQGTGAAGVFIGLAREVHIENCSIRNFRAGGGAAGILTQLASFTVTLFVLDTVINDNWNGIYFLSSGGFKIASLSNVTITGSTGDGLVLANSNTFVNVTESIISGNGGNAVNAAASSTTVNVDHSTIANNAVAFNAAAGSTVIRISANNIFNNTTGFLIASGGAIQSDSSNNTGGSNGGATVPNGVLGKN